MAKKQQQQQAPGEEPLEWRDPPPRGGGASGKGISWATRLLPLTAKSNTGQWAMVKSCTSPENAWNTAANLSQRKVYIPYPDHDWGFVSRGVEVFAVYRGAFPTQRINKRSRSK